MRFASCRFFALVLAALATCLNASAQQQTNIKTIYIMPSSHWDLGFLAPPEEILTRLKPHIDEVIANAKADPEFRWTIESAWQLREWLDHTSDPAQIQEFVALVNKGQIQLSASFGSMHTEFMGAEELNRLTYEMTGIEKRLGVHTDFAIMDDVPGFTSRLPQVLSRSGIKYFVNGSNLFLFGGTSLTPAKMPFYWQAPDGSKVLTWQTQSNLGGYTETEADYYLDPDALEPYTKEHFYPKEWNGLPRLEIMQRGVDKLLAKYAKAEYPYDSLLLLYLHDFISSNWEEKQLLPAIREWNAAGKQPHIQVCTAPEFFHHMESQYGADKFPVYAGDYSGLWSEVKTNSPGVSARARWLHDHWPVAEMIWSLLTFRNFTSLPAGNLDETLFKLLKYDEHSGAAQVGWPKLMTRTEVNEQNSEYVNYVKSGEEDIQYLLDSGLQTLLAQKPDPAPSLVIFNPLSWQRTDLAYIRSTANFTLRDSITGQIVPQQRVLPDEIAFLPENVPADGYKSYKIEPAATKETASPVSSALTLENSFYRLRVRSSDGALVSLFDKQLGVELVNSSSDQALNSLQRWIPAANLPVGQTSVKITHESGPIFDRITIERAGSLWPETRITLFHSLKRIEFSNLLDRDKMPFVASNQVGENYSFEFPFSFDAPAHVRLEDGIGFHEIPDDYLPGARTDAGVPQHSLALTGKSAGKNVTVTLSQRQAFFDYLPGLPGAKGPGKFLNDVRATVMRKQDQGETRDLGMVNFQTIEPGLSAISSYDFALTSNEGDLDPVASSQAGWSFDVPLISVKLDSGMAPELLQASFFTLSAPNVEMLAFKPSEDGNPEHYTIRLQEIAGKETDVDLKTPLKITEAEETPMNEDRVLSKLPIDPLRMHLLPHETFTLRVTAPHSHKKRSDRWWEW
jgi:glycosyl hydrolase family 38